MPSSVECSNIFERYFWTFIFSTRKQSDCLISFRYFVNIFSLLPSGFQDAMRANQRLPISSKTIKNIVAFQLNKGYSFHKLRGCESSYLIYGRVTFVNKLFSSSAVPTQTGQDKACSISLSLFLKLLEDLWSSSDFCRQIICARLQTKGI